jgi:hypothetical protein
LTESLIESRTCVNYYVIVLIPSSSPVRSLKKPRYGEAAEEEAFDGGHEAAAGLRNENCEATPFL